MKAQVKVLWIDDTDRQEDAKNLSSVEPQIKATYVHPNDFEPRPGKPTSSISKTPDIFLVDFYLNERENKAGHIFPHLGLTIGAVIRETFPERPIYLVTSKETERKDIMLQQWAPAASSLFDRVLSLKEVQRNGKIVLYHDALDYRSVRKASGKGLTALFRLLGVRDQDIRHHLNLVLPGALHDGVTPPQADGSGGDSILFACWVRDFLLVTPGLIYNELHSATFLGMTTEGFRRVAMKFEAARYSGIFSRTCPKVWWSPMLRKILWTHDRTSGIDSVHPWEIAPIIFQTAKKFRSRCAVCSEENPETVGVNSEDRLDLRPVHYRCSEPDPKRKKELYFDEPRAFDLGK